MSNISLNFFGEIFSVERTNNLSSLRNEVSKLLCLNSQDAEEIIMTYNDDKGNKITISNDIDLNNFLNSKATTIDLDISQQSQIYKENLNQLKEESMKDKNALEELLKKNEELEKLKTTKFISESQEIENINLQINELIKKKKELIERQNELRNIIFTGITEINKEQEENEQKITELQKKIGIPIAKKRKPKTNLFNNNIINNSVIDFKIGAKDNFGNNIFEKPEEKENKLTEKFKNLSLNSSDEEDIKEEDKKNKENKRKKEIHYSIICDGCNMGPLVGNRYKCKICQNFDYCEKCYEKNKTTHSHEFELIKKSEFKKPKSPQQSSFYFEDFSKFGDFGNYGRIFPFYHHHNRKRKRGDNRTNINNIPRFKNIHFGVQCDGCGVTPIIGARYKCAVCEQVDFCEQCNQKYGEKHGHPFLKE